MISDSIHRFILTSIDSVPHLEAILLFRHDPKKEWDAKTVAQSLFISEKNSELILSDLCAGQVIDQHDNFFVYHPVSESLKKMIDELADTYSKNLIEVTNLIHSKIGKQAQQFGDAFKWRKD